MDIWSQLAKLGLVGVLAAIVIASNLHIHVYVHLSNIIYY